MHSWKKIQNGGHLKKSYQTGNIAHAKSWGCIYVSWNIYNEFESGPFIGGYE